VEKDKSMSAMIQNDQEKEWMKPLLELRNELDVPDDRHLRDFRRMDGRVQLFYDGTIPGPYTKASRENWLLKLLTAQTWVRQNGPDDVRKIELITMEELHEIRRIWLMEKKEIEDSLPALFKLATGEEFPGAKGTLSLSAEMLASLRELCGEDALHYEMMRDLIATEQKFATMTRRKGLLEELDKSIKRSFYRDREDAIQFAREKAALYGGDESGEEEEGNETRPDGVSVQLRLSE
jgi:DNA sulfur modification protein DndC